MNMLFLYLTNFAIVAAAFFAFDALYPHGLWASVAAKSLLVVAGVACAWVNRGIREVER